MRHELHLECFEFPIIPILGGFYTRDYCYDDTEGPEGAWTRFAGNATDSKEPVILLEKLVLGEIPWPLFDPAFDYYEDEIRWNVNPHYLLHDYYDEGSLENIDNSVVMHTSEGTGQVINYAEGDGLANSVASMEENA